MGARSGVGRQRLDGSPGSLVARPPACRPGLPRLSRPPRRLAQQRGTRGGRDHARHSRPLWRTHHQGRRRRTHRAAPRPGGRASAAGRPGPRGRCTARGTRRGTGGGTPAGHHRNPRRGIGTGTQRLSPSRDHRRSPTPGAVPSAGGRPPPARRQRSTERAGLGLAHDRWRQAFPRWEPRQADRLDAGAL